MESRDVIVVGAGPAGSGCARALKEEAIDVLVLEKATLPRYKTCSGVLFGQTQELLRQYFGADPPEEVYCSNQKIIKAEDIREWDPERGYIPFAWEIDKDGKSFSRDYQNAWRDRFDKWLLDRSGAEYRDGMPVRAFEVRADHVVVRVQGGDGAKLKRPGEYRCKYLVGADGGASVVRRAFRKTADGEEAKAGVGIFQSYFKIESIGSLQQGAWTVFFDRDIGDMLSCVHQKDDYLLLCVGGFKGRNLRESLAKFQKVLAEKFDVRLGDRWRDEGCQMELAPPFLGEGRVLVTGEAAGFVYLNGEGISAAIDSGYRCGKAVAQAIHGKGDAVELYTEGSKDIAAHVRKCLSQIHFLSV